MKKIILLMALVLATTAAQAQLFKKKSTTVEPQYKEGTVPVVNGKVTFETEIAAEGLDFTKGRLTQGDDADTLVYSTWEENPDKDEQGNVSAHTPVLTTEERMTEIEAALMELAKMEG